MEEISADLAAKRGVSASHSKMDNGELRYRLMAADGSAYVRTEASSVGGWQNSHYHKAVLETYIVQKGWAALVELERGELCWQVMKPGDVYTTRPEVSHNVYLPAAAVIHVIKHGGTGTGGDWFSDEVLDSKTKHLPEVKILSNFD